MPANQPARLNHPAAGSTQEVLAAKLPVNSGALSPSEDVIRVTGSLVDFVAAKNLGSAMVVCTDCGNASDSGEMFCIHCGGLLEEPVASAGAATGPGAELCDDCGARVESDEIFCPSCGSVMASA
jgi:RNA polymerase subunit RPABC4/transcription elongation factor Spt4